MGSINNAEINLTHYISENPANTLTTIDNTTFNSMTPVALAAAYDIIVIPWKINSSANLDWTTRLLPYLMAGGNVLWEEPNNIGELAVGYRVIMDTSLKGVMLIQIFIKVVMHLA